VDGWGTIITPKGTFPALRIRHDIAEIDSVYQTFFGPGQWFGTPPIQRVEYEWFTNGEKEWILKATETNGAISLVEYQEDYLGLDASVSESGFNATVGPNPVEDVLEINADIPVSTVFIFDGMGRKVMETTHQQGFHLSLDVRHLAKGTYQVLLSTESGNREFSLVKF